MHIVVHRTLDIHRFGSYGRRISSDSPIHRYLEGGLTINIHHTLNFIISVNIIKCEFRQFFSSVNNPPLKGKVGAAKRAAIYFEFYFG